MAGWNFDGTNWFYSGTAYAGGEPLEFHPPRDQDLSGGNVAVTITGTDTVARVEHTTSHPDRVKAGTANWRSWPLGDISNTTPDSLREADLREDKAVTGLRLSIVAGDGSAEIEVLI
jgi:hypothetical protein